jgi:serine/threonine-protein kinase HipA
LREHSTHAGEDVQSFLDAIECNWLIAGTDAHAKNYALLLGAQGAVRLAPFYDLASILPYQSADINKAKLAMKIGGECRLRNIGLRHWRRLVADVRIDGELLIDRIEAMAAGFPDLVETIRKQVEADGLSHPIISALARRLESRARLCLARLG